MVTAKEARKGSVEMLFLLVIFMGFLIAWLLKKYPEMAILFDNISLGDVIISVAVLVLLPVIFSVRHLYTIPMGFILFAIWLITPLFIRGAQKRYLIRAKFVFWISNNLTPLYFLQEVFGQTYKDGRNESWQEWRWRGEKGFNHWTDTLEPLVDAPR